MNDRDARSRDFTEPPRLDQKRFELEWIVPLEPGLSAFVALYDVQCNPRHAQAVGEGGDEAETLLDLWTTLIDAADSADAVAYAAAAYCKRTGRQPDRTAVVTNTDAVGAPVNDID